MSQNLKYIFKFIKAKMQPNILDKHKILLFLMQGTKNPGQYCYYKIFTYIL